MSKHIPALFILTLLFFACEKQPNAYYDFNPKTKLCVSGFVTNDSIWIKLNNNISASYDLTHKLPNNFYSLPDSNAIINVYENGIFFDKLVFREDSEIYINDIYIPNNFYFSNKKTTEGKNYSIEVLVKGYEKVTASTFLPYRVHVEDFDTTCWFKTEQVYENWQYTRDTMILQTKVKLWFTDPVDKINYYAGWIKDYQVFHGYYNRAFINYAPFFDGKAPEYSPLIAIRFTFSDRFVNGKKIQIDYEISGETDSSILCLFSLSDDCYKMMQSVEKKYDATSRQFSEPVSLYSNVSNGMGIFNGYSTTYFTLPKREE